MPYNPHSQGVVERFHKTTMDFLYSIYADNKEIFELKESFKIVPKNIIIFIPLLNLIIINFFILIMKIYLRKLY